MRTEMCWRATVTYRKVGRLRYLSHLDVARAIERAIRRAGWPVAYTEGYHQRMKISLGPPLPVGAEGEAEMLTVSLAERASDEWALAALKLQLPEELAPTAVEVQPERAASPLKFLRRAAYIIELAGDDITREEVARAAEALLAAEHVGLRAEGKKPIDARPRIYSVAIAPDAPPVRIRASLGVAQDNYISPDRFLEALAQFLPRPRELKWRRVVRTRMYME